MIRKFWRWLWGEAIEGERTLLQKLHILLDFLAYWWHRLATSRYVLSLEDRVRMLEAQNTALHATVYGIRGLPPLPAGTVASYREQPAVMRQAPAITPHVDPIMPKRARTMAEEARRKQAADFLRTSTAHASKIEDELKAELDRTAQQAADRVDELRGLTAATQVKPVHFDEGSSDEPEVEPEGTNAVVQE